MRFLKTVTKAFILLLTFSFILSPVMAGGSGSIWTTKDDCGDVTQDVNHFAIGEHVFINGANFDEGPYDWDITGQSGGASCDPDIAVASGIFDVDASGAFCFDAYVVAPDDCGEYKASVDNKHDNYRVILEVFSCSDYSTQGDCEYFAECDWCPECDGTKWSGGSDRCVDTGACDYNCEPGYCGAECLPGTIGDSCLPEGTSTYYCLNNILYEPPEFNFCKDTCVWDNCQTKQIKENDPRCDIELVRPTCDVSDPESYCYIKPLQITRPTYAIIQPSFTVQIPKISITRPSYDFTMPALVKPTIAYPSWFR